MEKGSAVNCKEVQQKAAADVLCGCASIHFQGFGIAQRHIVV
jgi:hypothetical protein